MGIIGAITRYFFFVFTVCTFSATTTSHVNGRCVQSLFRTSEIGKQKRWYSSSELSLLDRVLQCGKQDNLQISRRAPNPSHFYITIHSMTVVIDVSIMQCHTPIPHLDSKYISDCEQQMHTIHSTVIVLLTLLHCCASSYPVIHQQVQ